MTSNLDFSDFWKAKYLPSLDGLRALCVLMVMFNHIHVHYPGWIIGWVGVDVFFVLSGFLITTLLIREREAYGRVSLKGFYARRFFRIIPVYLVTIVLYVAALWVSRDAVKISEFKIALPWLLSFMQEFRPVAAGSVLGHAWTLGIEEKFYTLWPPTCCEFVSVPTSLGGNSMCHRNCDAFASTPFCEIVWRVIYRRDPWNRPCAVAQLAFR